MSKSAKIKKNLNKYVIEYLKCKENFVYFCSRYIKIELPGGDVPLIPYNKQGELVDLFNKEHFVIVLKSRQIGISTIIQAYSAWLTIFYSNVVVGIISKDGKEATDFARVIRGMIEKLPDWLKPLKGLVGRGFAKKTEQSFILTNGSKAYASPVAPNAPDKTLRGKAITLLIIDEAAFVGKLDDAWTSLVPALSTNQKQAKLAGIPYGTIVLSTPNKTVGKGKWYFERYTNAISGTDIFKPFIIHWKMIPELADDPDWYKTQCELFNFDERKIAQELELKFLPTEGSFFTASTVETMQNSIKSPIKEFNLFNGKVWEFQEYDSNKFYIIGVDTASEQGSDKSAITIWDFETLEQVWEFQGKCKVLDFVKIVKVACSQYTNSLLVIESNSYGNQVIEEMNESEFSNLLYKEKRGENKLVAGLSTTAKTRPLMIDALYSYITEFPEIVKSERLSLELTGLVSKTNGRVEADSGCNDDLALSAAMAFYVRKYDSDRLMINSGTDRFLQRTNDLNAILSINNRNMHETTNSDIMRHVKNKLDNDNTHDGMFDIMSFYHD